MKKFKRRTEYVEAAQFFPDKPLPEGMTLWTNTIPRDMSWGYVDAVNGRVHILAGDWIIKKVDGTYIVRKPGQFEQLFEPATA